MTDILTSTHRTLRRFTKTVNAKLESRLAFSVMFGTVATVVTTAPGTQDGSPLVTVNIGGTLQPMGYLASYSPKQSDTVVVLSIARYPFILGRLVGLPSF